VRQVNDEHGGGTNALVGRWSELVPITSEDYPYLYDLTTSGDSALRWRYRGATPDPAMFQRQLWEGVLVQYLIAGRQSSRIGGLVAVHGAVHEDGYAYLSIVLSPEAQRAIWPFEGAIRFVCHVFQTWPLRKLYLNVPAFNMPPLASLVSRYASREGLLRDHTFAWGRYWDEHVLSIRRETVEEVALRHGF